jgi:hypothetical protein
MIIIHLLGQPPAGWLTAPEIQPEGRRGMKPNIGVNDAPAKIRVRVMGKDYLVIFL